MSPTTPIHPDAVYTADEAAELCRIGAQSLIRLARRGDLRAVRYGRKVLRFKGSALLEFLERGGSAVPMNAVTVPDQVRRRPRPQRAGA